jgi:hypothetical protein
MRFEDRSVTEQIGLNEATFRRLNESVHCEYGETDYAGLIGFLCECGDLSCELTIEMTRAEYESVRADARRFAVVADHAIAMAEDVVERHKRYIVVEKRPETAEVAERSDPRQ